jgi:hypothetical protein
LHHFCLLKISQALLRATFSNIIVVMDEKEVEKEIKETDWNHENILGFFSLLLEIDMRENPEIYDNKSL